MFWGHDGFSFLIILYGAIVILVGAHILLTKAQESSAVAWIGIVALSPFFGALAYWLFGINRIARRARRLKKHRKVPQPTLPSGADSAVPVTTDLQLLHLGNEIDRLPFLAGNRVTPLINGDQAYPEMLATIENAEATIALSSYIFDYDSIGERFIQALIAARTRGVKVFVLFDEFGLLYSSRSVDQALLEGGVATARFMSGRLRDLPFLNLRNHRKLMIADGKSGFIGGMNIRHGNVLQERPNRPVQDIHFKVEGPVINQMNAVFESDWRFASGDDLTLPSAVDGTSVTEASTPPLARVVSTGPDQDIDKLQWLLLGALAVARERVVIMTPYFLPNETLASALTVAALRGLSVEIVIPRRSNFRPLDWAMMAKWSPLVLHGVRVFLTAPPFDHSKVMVVDGKWVLVGSTNWDQRSLRLNFEANLECYDPTLAAQLESYVAAKRSRGRLILPAEVRATPIWMRLRNNLIRLFSAYL